MADQVAVVIATGLLVTSCSSALRVAAGPSVGYVKHERPAYGGEALARVALGHGDDKGFLALEAASRALANEQSQALELGLGPAWFGTFGQGLITVDTTALLGAERFDDKVLALGTLGAGVGGGVVFDQSTQYWGSAWGEQAGGSQTRLVKKTAVTLELTGNINLPFTRSPQHSLGLLVGITWLSQEEFIGGHRFEPLDYETVPIEIPRRK